MSEIKSKIAEIASKVKVKVSKIARLVASYVPTQLPNTPDKHEAWSASVCELSGYPLNDSFRQALAIMILHLGPTTSYKAKQYFIRSLDKTAANQIASHVIETIREAHKKGKLSEEASGQSTGT